MKYEDKLAFSFSTTHDIIRKISYIDTFKGRWNSVEQKNNRYLPELRRVAIIESIGSSTRIEGTVLTNEEVQKLIRKGKNTGFKTKDEQDVSGYYEALDSILNHAKEINFTESSIKKLHGILLRHPEKDQRHRGVYKALPNQVIANYPDGSQRMIFKTTAPYLTEFEMNVMVGWTTEALKIQHLHPLFAVGLFIYEFLSIHPFQDGNGRLSRLLTTLLLVKTGYDFIKYASFETIIEQRKTQYYNALIAGQQNRGTDQEIIGDWMLFFLTCLETLSDRLETTYSLYQQKGNYLNDRQKRILRELEKHQPAKISDLVSRLGDQSINTLKKDLQYLVQQGIIERLGELKATIYLIKG